MEDAKDCFCIQVKKVSNDHVISTLEGGMHTTFLDIIGFKYNLQNVKSYI